LVVVNNIFEFADTDFNFLMERLYSGRVPYVKYEHDHREITERKVKAQRLFDNATLSVFISPLQRTNHVTAFGKQLEEKSIALPLAIDVSKFTLLDEMRIGNSVLVPSMEKCRENTVDFMVKHPEYCYTIVGYADFPAMPNVKVHNRAQVNEMPVLYNRHEFILHLPQKIGGGERVVFEAVLCGCKVITNDNSAHTSWIQHWDWKDRSVLEEQLQKAPYAFWKAIDSCLQKR
jgi:hypothetical protein